MHLFPSNITVNLTKTNKEACKTMKNGKVFSSSRIFTQVFHACRSLPLLNLRCIESHLSWERSCKTKITTCDDACCANEKSRDEKSRANQQLNELQESQTCERNDGNNNPNNHRAVAPLNDCEQEGKKNLTRYLFVERNCRLSDVWN